MSNEIQTFLVTDNRISGITDQITVAVTAGPSSSSIQKYKQSSNSSSNIAFSVKVPSENTLCNRAIRVETILHATITFTEALTVAQPLNIVPSSFPMNSGLFSSSARVNNSLVSVASGDVLEVLKKQYHQSYLTKHCQMTPNFVDTNFGNIDDAAEDTSSSYMSGVRFAAADSATCGRANSNISYIVYSSGGAVLGNSSAGVYTLAPGDSLNAYVDVSMKVTEPILFLPGFELDGESPAFLGLSSIDVNLQINDCKNCIYLGLTGNNKVKKYEIRKGTKKNLTSNFFDEQSFLVMNYISMHASDYSKISSKNVIPYNEYTYNKSLYTRTSDAIGSSGSFSVLGSQQSLTQIPNLIYITVAAPWSDRPLGVSNSLFFPIGSISLSFNNRVNLLSEMSPEDLYTMSRRNGSTQSYMEFMGFTRNSNGDRLLSLGSIIIINVSRDLSLDDYLSAGSLGSFSLQITANCNNYEVAVPGKTTIAASSTAELNVICSYSSILITQQGSSVSMSSLLTKSLVLDTKDKNQSIGDYDELAKLQGGNANKSMTSLGDALRKKGTDLFKNKASTAIQSLGGHYNVSGGSKLSKYT